MSNRRIAIIAVLMLLGFSENALPAEKIKGEGEKPSPEKWMLKRHGLIIDLPSKPSWKVLENTVEFKYLSVNKAAKKMFLVHILPSLAHQTLDDKFIHKFEEVLLKSAKGHAKVVSRKKFLTNGAPSYEITVLFRQKARSSLSLFGVILANEREYRYAAGCACDNNIRNDSELGKVLKSIKLVDTGKKWDQDFVEPGENHRQYRYRPNKTEMDFIEKLKKDIESGK